VHSGAVAMQLRSYGDALLCFDRALALSSACVPALLNRAMCYHRMGNMQRAEEDYSTVISISPVRQYSADLCFFLHKRRKCTGCPYAEYEMKLRMGGLGYTHSFVT
jgi:hypothetical protein